MGVLLQLERFDRAGAMLPARMHSPEDLQDAYAAGVIAGRAQAEAEQGEALKAALAELAHRTEAMEASLADERAIRARSLAPLIGALMEGVLPALSRARLEAALLEAFVRLSRNAVPLGIRLRCGPDLSDFIAACASEAGIGTISISADGPAGTVTAELLGGAMCWNEADVAAQLRALVQEVMEGN